MKKGMLLIWIWFDDFDLKLWMIFIVLCDEVRMDLFCSLSCLLSGVGCMGWWLEIKSGLLMCFFRIERVCDIVDCVMFSMVVVLVMLFVLMMVVSWIRCVFMIFIVNCYILYEYSKLMGN